MEIIEKISYSNEIVVEYSSKNHCFAPPKVVRLQFVGEESTFVFFPCQISSEYMSYTKSY